MSTQKKVKIQKIFSERLNSLVGERSVSAFARYCGLKQAAVDRYTKASSLPAADAIVAIAETCGVSSDWLLGLTDTRTPGAGTATATNGSAAATGNASATVTNSPAPPATPDAGRYLSIIESQQRVIETLSNAVNKRGNPPC